MKLEYVLHNPPKPIEIQELLCLAGYSVLLDGDLGPATRAALRAFRSDRGIPEGADGLTIEELTRPFRLAINIPARFSLFKTLNNLPKAVVAVAREYLQLGARELGGNNKGPWVRFFSQGAQGPTTAWCANFSVMTVLRQAIELVQRTTEKPISWDAGSLCSPWCPTIEARARKLERLVPSEHVKEPMNGSIFLVRGASRSTHVGVCVSMDVTTGVFESIEGNASKDDGEPGRNAVVRKFRNFKVKPYYFIQLTD